MSSAYPAVEPRHRALVPGLALGSALQGISAYLGPGGWHFVTYGLTGLWTKDCEHERRSSWGYELTMLTPATDEPPDWVFSTLAGLAQSTWDSGRTHDAGDRIDVLDSIDGGDSGLEAFAVAEDPS